MNVTGYPLTQWTMRPFADHDLTNNADEAARRKQFNVHLSRARQRVEHAIGRLKGRFRILRSIPGYKMPEIFKMVESLFVLHNILEELGDDPATIEGFNGEEDDTVREAMANLRARAGERNDSDTLLSGGLLRRKILLKHLFPLDTDSIDSDDSDDDSDESDAL
jgi:hypothetical protein